MKTTFGELAGSIGNVAKTAEKSNLSLEDLLSATSQLTLNGIGTSESMTGMKAALSNIIKPSAEAQKMAKKLGLEFNVGGIKAKGFGGFLKELKEKTGGNIETMGKLFGSTEALNMMMILTSDEGLAGFNEVSKEMQGNMNLVDEAFNNMTEGSGAQMKLAFNDLKIALVELGDVLAPIIFFMAEKISELAEWFGNLDKGTQENIVTFIALAAAIGPLLSVVGNLFTVGSSVVSMFGKLAGGAATASGATAGASASAGLLATVGIPLAIAALGLLIAEVGDSSGAINTLQEKFGGLGFIIGAVCEHISGIVQITFGNFMALIGGVCDMIAAMLDGPGGMTVSDAWARMNSRIELNNQEAMGKMLLTTSTGLSQMRTMTDEQLGLLTTNLDTIMGQIPLIMEGKYSEASTKVAAQLQTLDATQLGTLTGMNETTKAMFGGINASMTVEEKAKKVASNLEHMKNAGKLNAEGMQKDIDSAMKLIGSNIDVKTKEASNKADANTKNMANKVDANTKKMASTNVATNTKELATQVDKNTKEATIKAETNTQQMANKVDANAKEMKDDATKHAKEMKTNVTNATSSMADSAIRDWQRIRNEYSRSISGKVNVTKTTTNVTKSVPAPGGDTQSLNDIGMALPSVDLGNYKLKGSYYSSISRASSSITNNSVNINMNGVESLLKKLIKEIHSFIEQDKQDINIENTINISGNASTLEMKRKGSEFVEMMNRELRKSGVLNKR